MDAVLGVIAAPAGSTALPAGFRVRLDPRLRFWSGGSILVGGSPWRISRINLRARPFLALLRENGASGASATSALERSVARLLIDRGFAVPISDTASALSASVVVPAFGRVAALIRCLDSLCADQVIVVDDCSPDDAAIAAAATRSGAKLIRHTENRGPAAARNTGVLAAGTDLIAFVDSDCTVEPGWLAALARHFDDPKVALVAPRVQPDVRGGTVLARHEAARSALDMGRTPELVKPGARLGFVPSAVIVVRRSAIAGSGFDDSLRLGEDVDLVWWISRRFAYGTSAADLARRHPGRLTPLRVSGWNLAALTFVIAGRPRTAIATAGSASMLLLRRLQLTSSDALLAPVTVASGIVADAAATGHVLRREWWPLGALCLAMTPRSRIARAGAVAMLAPVVWEYATRRPALDPVRYTALRFVEDAAYGSGVIASSLRARTAAPLTPEVRLPSIGRRSRAGRSS
jgi:hypothetical protein